ncbi:MAG: hypothetical protein CMP20_01775 [Rickettsiales bacterium]|nr:hypothetical protein [Rickettsiales bacterium]
MNKDKQEIPGQIPAVLTSVEQTRRKGLYSVTYVRDQKLFTKVFKPLPSEASLVVSTPEDDWEW